MWDSRLVLYLVWCINMVVLAVVTLVAVVEESRRSGSGPVLGPFRVELNYVVLMYLTISTWFAMLAGGAGWAWCMYKSSKPVSMVTPTVGRFF
jgi:uncharacterized membrane protein